MTAAHFDQPYNNYYYDDDDDDDELIWRCFWCDSGGVKWCKSCSLADVPVDVAEFFNNRQLTDEHHDRLNYYHNISDDDDDDDVGLLGLGTAEPHHNSHYITGNNDSYAWFPPFRCRSAVAVLSFRSAVPLYRCHSSIVSYRCHCAWERNCWKRLSIYIGMKWPEHWLVVRLRQNGKK